MQLLAQKVCFASVWHLERSQRRGWGLALKQRLVWLAGQALLAVEGSGAERMAHQPKEAQADGGVVGLAEDTRADCFVVLVSSQS